MPKAFFLTAATLCKTPGESKDGKVTKPAVLDPKLPGMVADVSQEDFDHLLENGAIRELTSDELKLAAGSESAKTVKKTQSTALATAEQAVLTAQAKVDTATDDAAKAAATTELTVAQTALAALKA